MYVRTFACACAWYLCVRGCVRRCSGYGPDGTATKVDPLQGPFDVYYTAAPTRPRPPSRTPMTAREIDVAAAFLSSSSSGRGCAGAVNAISAAISAVAALHLRASSGGSRDHGRSH